MPLKEEEAVRLQYREQLHDSKHHVWKVNGKPKFWIKSGRFEVPIKYGLYDFGYLTSENFKYYHLPSECEYQTPGSEERARYMAEAQSDRIRKRAQRKTIRRFIDR